MTTSPMLNTLASGQPRGIAQMSPRTNRRGWSSKPEFLNSFAVEAMPADRTAAGPDASVRRVTSASEHEPERLTPGAVRWLLAVAYFVLAVLYAWQASQRVSPTIFSDEIEFTQISRGIAEGGSPSRLGEPSAALREQCREQPLNHGSPAMTLIFHDVFACGRRRRGKSQDQGFVDRLAAGRIGQLPENGAARRRRRPTGQRFEHRRCAWAAGTHHGNRRRRPPARQGNDGVARGGARVARPRRPSHANSLPRPT